ncbi:hypothetical protein ACTFIW_004208 [Dictyostelium discoideum]
MKSIFTILLILFYLLNINYAQIKCIHQSKYDKTYNLNSLEGPESYLTFISQNDKPDLRAHINFCENATHTCILNKIKAPFIQELGCKTIGEKIVYEPTIDGLKIVLTGEEKDCVKNNGQRNLTINLVCGTRYDSTLFKKQIEDNKIKEIAKCIYDVTYLTNTVCVPCPTGCGDINSYGTCDINDQKGCVCDSYTNGEICDHSRIEITNKLEVIANGGNVTFKGYFGDNSSPTEISIDEFKCDPIFYISENELKCKAGENQGTKDVILRIGKLEPVHTKIFFNGCIGNCSSNGECQFDREYKCNCNSLTNGKYCEHYDLNLNSIAPLNISGGITTLYGNFGSPNDNFPFIVYIGSYQQCINLTHINETTITCYVGPGSGIHNAIISIGKFNSSAKVEFKYIECSLNCSNHGICLVLEEYGTGSCDCDSQTIGNSCEISKLYISSIDSTSIEGGNVTIYGYFGILTSKATILIGDLQCTDINQFNNSTINCIIGKGSGIKDVEIIDNDLIALGKKIFKYIQPSFNCSTNCYLNGNCNTTNGACICSEGFTGIDCSSNGLSPSTPNVNLTTGESSIINEKSQYFISIFSLVEINYNGTIVKEFLLENSWNKSSSSSSSSSSTNDTNINNIVTFSQNLNNDSNCKIEYIIEQVVGKDKMFSFCDVDFIVVSGSIKLTIVIENYKYLNNLNSLQLIIKSTIGKNETNNNNINNIDCNSKKLNINSEKLDNSNSLNNYFSISKDSKTFYGRFINKVLSDDRPTFISTSVINNNYNSNNDMVLIGLDLPHFLKKVIIDPDFSLLVNSDFKTSCDDTRPKWFLYVVIGAPAVTFVLIIIVGSVIYYKKKVEIKIIKHNIKMAAKGLKEK